jgi:ubiquinone/menaquinone biosynthesis C-methylase UbiE
MTDAVNWTRYQKDWNEFSEMDPFWAVLADPAKKHGKWNGEEFYRSGQVEIDALMEKAKVMGYPAGREWSLDFGCGLGRLTRGLSRHFEETYGVDISETMLAKARELNRDFGNCQFVHNPKNDLQVFGDNHFDLIYSNIVLQHVPSKKMIRSYIAEFVRILKPNGLLVFQLPSHIPLLKKIQPRRRLYSMLRGLGFSEKILYWRLGLFPILMNYLPEKEVTELLKGRGAKVLESLPSPDAGPLIESRRYCVTK